MSFCRSHKIKAQNVFSWEEIVIEEQMVNDDKMSINDIIEESNEENIVQEDSIEEAQGIIIEKENLFERTYALQ